MSTFRMSNIGPLTGNTASVVDPATPVGGSAAFGPLVSFAGVNATSGTIITFSGIPSWSKRITAIFNSLVTTGTTHNVIQLGTSGGVVTSGYLSYFGVIGPSTGSASTSNGFGFWHGGVQDVRHGSMTITNVSGNIWVASYGAAMYNGTNNYSIHGGGSVTLSSALTSVSFATGTADTFSSGYVNVFYE